jgi:hypothetical protein
MDSLVVAEILDVLSDKHLDTMTLHLGERGQLEGNELFGDPVNPPEPL